MNDTVVIPGENSDTQQTTTTTTMNELIALDLFATLENAQNGHGIAHQDYLQYWNYCTSKLSRLRHVKPVRTTLVHNPKYETIIVPTTTGSSSGVEATSTSTNITSTTKGNKRKNGYGKRSLEYTGQQPIIHVNILWNLIFQAERAWAQACSVQQGSQIGTSTPALLNNKYSGITTKSKHGYIQRRLNKAVKFATALVETIKLDNGTTTTNRTGQECYAYLAWTIGNAQLEHKNYKLAYNNYKQCLIILLTLANDVKTFESSNKEEYKKMITMQDVWINRAETIIRPLVRYCQYEAKGLLSREDLQLPSPGGEMIDGANANDDDDDDESGDIVLSFRGKDVSLDKDASYKELAVLYLKMESSLKHPESLIKSFNTNDDEKDDDDHDHEKDVEGKFIQLLSDLDDAIAMSQTEYNRYESLPSGPTVTSKRDELAALLGYFRYQRLLVWRYQQEARISKLNKQGDDDNYYDPVVMVHAYDALLQNGTKLSDLLSTTTTTGNASNDDVLEDDVLWLEAQAHLVRIRAIRCYHLARLYESSPSLGATPKQLLSLLKHCRLLLDRATEEIAAISDDEHDDGDDDDHDNNNNKSNQIDLYLSELEMVSDKIKVIQCRVKAALYLAKIGEGSSAIKTNRPLWLRLNEWDAGDGITTLADDPPLPIPIPCKGTFFDIAWQHIGTDFSTDIIEQFVSDNEPKKSRSVGGGGGFLGWLTGNS